MIDLHSHILPGIDDGAPDWDTSIEMCKIAVADGVHTMVATPHMLDGVHNVKRQTILDHVGQLQSRLNEMNIKLTVLPGADVHIGMKFVQLLESGSLVTVNDTGKYVLVEFPHEVLPSGIDQLLYSIQVAGAVPIITHPERQSEVQRKPEVVFKWVTQGNLVQVTAASITGELGKTAKACSHSLLQGGLVHIIASDAHSSTWRAPGLSKAKKVVAEMLSPAQAEEMVTVLPQKVIDGDYIEIPEPEDFQPLKRKNGSFSSLINSNVY